MSSGYCACNCVIMEEEEVDKLTSGKVQKLKDLLDSQELDLCDLFYSRACEEPLDVELPREEQQVFEDEITDLYYDIKTDFHENTGLDLHLNYHNSENDGDCYDEINGIFWEVQGVYQYTPGGEKFKNILQYVSFVEWG